MKKIASYLKISGKTNIPGKDFTLTVDSDSFMIRETNNRQGEVVSEPMRRTKTTVKKFNKFVDENKTKIRSMNMKQLIQAMEKENIDYHSYFMDI